MNNNQWIDERLTFQDAPYKELCSCVYIAVTTPEQNRLNHLRPKDRSKMLEALFSNTNRNRTYQADCEKCDTGLTTKGE